MANMPLNAIAVPMIRMILDIQLYMETWLEAESAAKRKYTPTSPIMIAITNEK